jgi:hypothetical protein
MLVGCPRVTVEVKCLGRAHSDPPRTRRSVVAFAAAAAAAAVQLESVETLRHCRSRAFGGRHLRYSMESTAAVASWLVHTSSSLESVLFASSAHQNLGQPSAGMACSLFAWPDPSAQTDNWHKRCVSGRK